MNHELHETYCHIRDRMREHGRGDAFIQNTGGGLEAVEIPVRVNGEVTGYVWITEDSPYEYLIGVYDEAYEDEGVVLVLNIHPPRQGMHGALNHEEVVADRIHGFLARLGQ